MNNSGRLKEPNLGQDLLRVTETKWAQLLSFQQQQPPHHTDKQIAQQQLQQEQL